MLSDEKLNVLKGRGMRLGTQNERMLLDLLGSPDERLKIVHIAGTNGKGSVAMYLESILFRCGKKVGCFTSPAVYRDEEQYAVNCESVSPEELEENLDKVYNIGEKSGIRPTLFEVQAAAAIKMFAGRLCEYAVLECGMGGRDDATNAVRKKELSIITPVSLEHTEYLGSTIEEICANKFAIAKGSPVLISCGQCEKAKRFFAGKSEAVFMPEPEDIRDEADGTSFSYRGREYFVKGRGYAAATNAATAIEAAKMLGFDIEDAAKGVAEAEISGRIEVIKKGERTYVLDGAHNPAAFEPLADFLKGRRAAAIYGRLKDKDADGCMKALKSADISKLYVISAEGPRAADRGETLAICKKYFPNAEERDLRDALEESDGEYVAVCGSFTVLKEAKNWIETR